MKACLKLSRNKFGGVPALAECLSQLGRYRPTFVVKLVDKLLEEMYRGLDAPHKRDPQRLLGMLRLIGELYNHSGRRSPPLSHHTATIPLLFAYSDFLHKFYRLHTVFFPYSVFIFTMLLRCSQCCPPLSSSTYCPSSSSTDTK